MASANGKCADEAFVTLATNDIYARGALVLAESLKKHGTTRLLVVMVTPHVSPLARSALEEVFDSVRTVDVLDSGDTAHLALLKRPELGITFTKIHCWTFTEFKKCVFMDADMLVLQNIDELFSREELSAAPDSGWPDLFNSGLFVFCPCLETFNGLLSLAETEGSFDGGDQGLLNTYFNTWATKDISRHLPFLYNLHVSASYTYLPAFKKFGKDTKVVHFLGQVKPWHHVYNRVTGNVHQITGSSQPGAQHVPQYLSKWWAIYNSKVQRFFSREQELTSPFIDDVTASSLPADPSAEQTTMSELSSSPYRNIVLIPPVVLQAEAERKAAEATALTDEEAQKQKREHMRDWERGEIDYMGRDSFANIKKALDLLM